MRNEITEFELNRYEYIRANEELEILKFNILNDYKALYKKLKKELPRYSISFIDDDDFIVDSYFNICNPCQDPRNKDNITYKGITYNLLDNIENKYKINAIIDDYFKSK